MTLPPPPVPPEQAASGLLSEQELRAIRERAEKATLGPWTNEWWYARAGANEGVHAGWKFQSQYPPGKCAYCVRENTELVRTETEGGGVFHIHRWRFTEPDNDLWRCIHAADGTGITGNYDYEEGGVSSTKDDSAFIAHARTDIPALLDHAAALARRVEAAEQIVRAVTELANANTLVWEMPANIRAELTGEELDHLNRLIRSAARHVQDQFVAAVVAAGEGVSRGE